MTTWTTDENIYVAFSYNLENTRGKRSAIIGITENGLYI